MLEQVEGALLRSLGYLTLLVDDNPRSGIEGSDSEGVDSESVSDGQNKDRAEASHAFVARQERKSQPGGGSLVMVRASTQQTVDRIVGTAAIIGLSVVFVRWLSNSSSSHRSAPTPDGKQCKKSREEKYSRIPWWWPVLALRRSNDQRRGESPSKDRRNNESEIENDAEYEHRGSCTCGSIEFALRGPSQLQTVESPGKIRHPHIPMSADRFQLRQGESEMRFYYEETDDSSSITFEQAGEERNIVKEASGAIGFCGTCGVHILHADRTSGALEVNANCLHGGKTKLIYREQPSDLSSISMKQQGKSTPLQRSPSSLSSNLEAENGNSSEQPAKNSGIETVSETEPFLGPGRLFEERLDEKHNNGIPRKESVSSDPTQPESFSSTNLVENDDSSMGSSSVTGASMLLHHSTLSAASGAASYVRADRKGLPPLPPSRISSSDRLPPSKIPSDRSVQTLPPWLGERPRYSPRAAGSVGGSGWSVASMESSDLNSAEELGKTTISPRMRDQMKKYMGRHMQKGIVELYAKVLHELPLVIDLQRRLGGRQKRARRVVHQIQHELGTLGGAVAGLVQFQQRSDRALEDTPPALGVDVVLSVARQGGHHIHLVFPEEVHEVRLIGLQQYREVAPIDDGQLPPVLLRPLPRQPDEEAELAVQFRRPPRQVQRVDVGGIPQQLQAPRGDVRGHGLVLAQRRRLHVAVVAGLIAVQADVELEDVRGESSASAAESSARSATNRRKFGTPSSSRARLRAARSSFVIPSTPIRAIFSLSAWNSTSDSICCSVSSTRDEPWRSGRDQSASAVDSRKDALVDALDPGGTVKATVT
ncbi:hypothetical protein ACHAWF_018862 [Thalassiosira exigua]